MKVEKRTEPLRVVRANNKVPGVLFGKSLESLSIQMEEKDFNEALREYGNTQTFNIKVGKVTHTVYIKEVQRDILNHHKFLNVKLLKVGKGDKITAHVPLDFLGKEKVERPGVQLHIATDSIEVEYEVGKGVSHIEYDISDMTIGDSLRIRDIVLPKGLKVLDDEDKFVLSVSEFTYVEEETEVVEAEVEADPKNVEAIKQKPEQ